MFADRVEAHLRELMICEIELTSVWRNRPRGITVAEDAALSSPRIGLVQVIGALLAP